jgi:hypothetical protein
MPRQFVGLLDSGLSTTDPLGVLQLIRAHGTAGQLNPPAFLARGAARSWCSAGGKNEPERERERRIIGGRRKAAKGKRNPRRRATQKILCGISVGRETFRRKKGVDIAVVVGSSSIFLWATVGWGLWRTTARKKGTWCTCVRSDASI